MKVLILCPYPVGQSPSQRFRFEQYFGLLQGHGIQHDIQTFWGADGWKILYSKGKFIRKLLYLGYGFLKRTLLLFRLPRYDFVFLHREAAPLGPPIFEWITVFIFRRKIIYDFDDAIWLSNTSKENRVASWLKWHGKVESICRWSYKISCGNEYLADYARTFNAAVIINPTTIDTETLHNPDRYEFNQRPDEFTIGWTGSHSTIDYLVALLPVIESICRKYRQAKLLLIADRNPLWNSPCLEFVQWDKKSEIKDLLRMDVGIMPLPDEPWAYGKCGFKALQYLSLGKPALVSPIGVNLRMVEHGVNGYHCRTQEEWFQHIEYLIQNPQVRNEMGKRGRREVQTRYSVTSNSPNFLSLFE